MTFIAFCEAIIERPLLEHEIKLIKYLEEHPDAKVVYPRARGLTKMPYQEWLSILHVLYKGCGKECRNELSVRPVSGQT